MKQTPYRAGYRSWVFRATMVISSREAYSAPGFAAMITSDQDGYAPMKNI